MNYFEEQKPMASVIIPAHNEERHIEKCLESLRTQTTPPNYFEVILVNNNSTDRTKEIAQLAGIKVLDKATGPVGAVRNFGASHAKGDVFFFLDADCVAPAKWIETGLDLVKGKPGAAFGGSCLVKENANWIEKYWLLPSKIPERNLLGSTTILSREDFYSINGFDEEITSGEDSKLSETLRYKGVSIKILPELSVVHLGNPGSIFDFIKRQAWHSENYLREPLRSLKDPTFYLTITFILTSLAVIISALINVKLSIYPGLLLLALPSVLSAKRILRSKRKRFSPTEIFKIYLLDYSYLIGRTIGTLKGIIKT